MASFIGEVVLVDVSYIKSGRVGFGYEAAPAGFLRPCLPYVLVVYNKKIYSSGDINIRTLVNCRYAQAFCPSEFKIDDGYCLGIVARCLSRHV